MKKIGDDCGEITTGNSMGDTARVIATAMTGSHTLRGYPAENGSPVVRKMRAGRTIQKKI